VVQTEIGTVAYSEIDLYKGTLQWGWLEFKGMGASMDTRLVNSNTYSQGPCILQRYSLTTRL